MFCFSTPIQIVWEVWLELYGLNFTQRTNCCPVTLWQSLDRVSPAPGYSSFFQDEDFLGPLCLKGLFPKEGTGTFQPLHRSHQTFVLQGFWLGQSAHTATSKHYRCNSQTAPLLKFAGSWQAIMALSSTDDCQSGFIFPLLQSLGEIQALRATNCSFIMWMCWMRGSCYARAKSITPPPSFPSPPCHFAKGLCSCAVNKLSLISQSWLALPLPPFLTFPFPFNPCTIHPCLSSIPWCKSVQPIFPPFPNVICIGMINPSCCSSLSPIPPVMITQYKSFECVYSYTGIVSNCILMPLSCVILTSLFSLFSGAATLLFPLPLKVVDLIEWPGISPSEIWHEGEMGGYNGNWGTLRKIVKYIYFLSEIYFCLPNLQNQNGMIYVSLLTWVAIISIYIYRSVVNSTTVDYSAFWCNCWWWPV